ncbi:MAG: trimethylamine methyltransferase family protein [Chloroflexia bacterium]
MRQGQSGILRSQPPFSRLTPEQCARIHEASLEILERAGARLFEPEAVELLREAGAQVTEGNRVRVPRDLVEEALQAAPKQLLLYDRKGRPALDLRGIHTYYGPGSDCMFLIDHRTGERRRPLLRDVVEGVTLCDVLEEIDFVMSLFLPADVPSEIADRYQMEAMLNHTTKPIIFVAYDLAGCRDAVAMAEAVAGGEEALRQRPFVACYVNSTTGLLHNTEALQKLLYMAEKGLPVIYVPGTSAGVTEPVPIAGSTAVKNAGALLAVTLAQRKRKGTPVLVPGWGGVPFDMRSLVRPYCGPDQRGVAESLAHFYGLPMFSLAGASDAKTVDEQAGIEAALTMLFEAVAGGHLVHDLGYLESGMSGSLAQLLICAEIVSWIRHALQEVEVNEETLAIDLVVQKGPDGDYLKEPHTRKHFREHWYPHLLDREPYGQWAARGGKTLAQRAAERVEEILSRHRPEPLPESVASAVHAVVERAAGSLRRDILRAQRESLTERSRHTSTGGR